MSTAAADSANLLHAAATAPWLPQAYRIVGLRRELPDTVTLEARPASGACPGALPGQFNMLYAFGVGEIPISVSGECTGERGFVHTVRAVGPVSRAIAALDRGAFLGVRGPFGTGWPLGAARGADLLIIAGGLGLAPLRPVIQHAIRERGRFGRVALLCGARDPEALLYREELALWRESLAVELTVDHAGVDWAGHVGVVPELIGRADFDPAQTIAMVCGPEVMMRFTAEALVAAGVARERIHLSLERNMKCAIGLCGHCQLGPAFICRDGPVMRYDRVAALLAVREL